MDEYEHKPDHDRRSATRPRHILADVYEPGTLAIQVSDNGIPTLKDPTIEKSSYINDVGLTLPVQVGSVLAIEIPPDMGFEVEHKDKTLPVVVSLTGRAWHQECVHVPSGTARCDYVLSQTPLSTVVQRPGTTTSTGDATAGLPIRIKANGTLG